MSETPRLLLLDGHSLAYRAFFALPVENFSTQTGQPTNAVFGFTSMLINVLRDERPTHIIVSFDVSRQSFRTEHYAEYKAGRSETPKPFQGQVSLVKEVLDALRIPVVEMPGYEADDVIATLTTQAREAGMEVVISTGDRDAFQLVDEHVTVLYPVRGVSEVWRMTRRGRRGEVLRAARAIPRQGRAGRRDQRQPAGRARRGRQDRGQVDQAVRRPRRRHRQRRQDQGQGRREPARPPGRRDAQLRDQQAGVRSRAAAAPRGRALGGVGPRGGAPGLRRARVPGPARPALPIPRRGRARGRVRLRPRRRGPLRRRGVRAGSSPTRRWARRSASRSPAGSAGAPAS